jgi:hypothetical protein
MTITDSRFYDNYATCCGGAIDDGGVSFWSVERTHFRNNTAFRGGALFRYGTGPVLIKDSLFEDSAASASGALITSSNLLPYFSYTDSSFLHLIGGIIDVGSQVGSFRFEGCHFLRSWAQDGPITRTGAGGKVFFKDCIVEQSVSYNNIVTLSANIGMENVLFRNNTKVYSAVLAVRDVTDVIMRNITLEDNQSSQTLEVSTTDEGTPWEMIVLRGNRATEAPIVVSGVGSCTFIGLDCTLNVGSRGGCLKAGVSARVNLTDSNVRLNKASLGGAIYAEANAYVNVFNSQVSGNQASYGGAVSFTAQAIVALSGQTSVIENTARIAGGALFFDAEYTSCPRFQGVGVTVQGNQAANGGAMYWAGLPRETCDSVADMCASCLLSNIANNSATINGAELASLPIELRLASELSSTYATSQRFDVKLSIIDSFGQALKVSDYVVSATAYELVEDQWQPVFLGGVTTKDFRVSSAEAQLDAMAFVSKPGSTMMLTFATEPPTSILNRTLSIRNCDDTEYLHFQDNKYFCLRKVDIAPAISIAMTIVGIVGVVIALALALIVFLYREESVIRKSSASFSMVICIGCVVMFASAVSFAWTSPGACGIRAWLLTIGFGLVYGSLFIKVRSLAGVPFFLI